MKKALPLILWAYVLLCTVYMVIYTKLSLLPRTSNPTSYFQSDRRNDLLGIADYMRERDINVAVPSLAAIDPALDAMMKKNHLDKVEFVNHGVVVFGAFKGRMSFEYHYGENMRAHVDCLMSKYPEWTYFQINQHWYFVSNRKCNEE